MTLPSLLLCLALLSGCVGGVSKHGACTGIGNVACNIYAPPCEPTPQPSVEIAGAELSDNGREAFGFVNSLVRTILFFVP